MNKIGYARVSSLDQNIDRQIQVLERETTKIFTDKESGTSRKRQGLKELLDYIRTDDIVVVTELDRLSRNNEHLTEIMGIIQSKGATLEVLNFPSLLGIKDDNLRKLLNNLILEIIKYQAQAERDRIKERQRQYIHSENDIVRLISKNKYEILEILDFETFKNKSENSYRILYVLKI